MTISIGVVTTNPCGECSVEKLIQTADAALYQAKANGRNRVQAVQHLESPVLNPALEEQCQREK